MEQSSPGSRYWTTYEAEGNFAHVVNHYSLEQTQAAIKPRQPFSLRFFGLGAGIELGVRCVSLVEPGATSSTALALAPAGLSGAVISTTLTGDVLITSTATGRSVPFASPPSTRRVLTPPASQSSKRRLDGGLFDPWDDPLPDWVNEDPFPPLPPLPPGGGGGGGGGFTHAAVRIELFAPGINDAVATWELPEGIAGNVRTVKFEPIGFPGPNHPSKKVGWWTMTCTPTGHLSAMMHLEAHATYTRVPFRTQALSTRLFDHLFRVALEALVPRASVSGSTLTVSIGEELAKEFGIPTTLASESISPVTSSGKLTSLNITAVSGRQLKEIAKTKNRTPLFLGGVQDDYIAIRIQAAFDKASFSALGFDLAQLQGDFGELFLVFTPQLLQVFPLSFLDVDFSTVAAFLKPFVEFFAGVKIDVNVIIESGIMKHERESRTYLREVLSRAAGKNAVLHEVRFGSGAWQMRYFIDPPIPNINFQPRDWLDDVVGGVGGVGGLVEDYVLDDEGMPGPTIAGGIGGIGGIAPSAAREAPGPAADNANDPLGVFPPEFKVVEGPGLARLDRHRTILVVMMENRSFDHLLGDLASLRPGREYDGPPSNASNAGVGGFIDRVPFATARDLAIGTAIPVDPRHGFAATKFQIGDGTQDGGGTGAMDGFARDLAVKTDSPQLALSEYSQRHLQTYYRLADEFVVCDRWFAAHPGPTWPNRFATVMGSIPSLNNFPLDFPDLGYLKDRTIFDVLNSHSIEWKVYESDLSLVRMFDRYRLDDRRVVPIDDPILGLDATLRTPGDLPRVMFVEPNFADLPPLATANDDHPPADLSAGQAFIARVCDAIWSTNRFQEVLMVVTYDEHGGFYDHVAPPGTEKGTLAPKDSIPKLHPDGPNYMGVRVPAFLISPLIHAGVQADHTIYDHTSILKSILVHNRAKLPRSVFGSFGERVNQSNHFGQSLTEDTIRPAPDAFDPLRRKKPSTGGTGGIGPGGVITGGVITGGLTTAVVTGGVVTSGVMTGGVLSGGVVTNGGVLTGGGVITTAPDVTLPVGPPVIPPRSVAIVPRTTTPPQELDESDEPDFHTALKGALKPKS